MFLLLKKTCIFNSLFNGNFSGRSAFLKSFLEHLSPSKTFFFRAGQRKHLPSLCENLTQVGSSRISCTKYYHNFNCTVVYSSQEDISCYKFSSKFARRVGMVSFLKSWFSWVHHAISASSKERLWSTKRKLETWPTNRNTKNEAKIKLARVPICIFPLHSLLRKRKSQKVPNLILYVGSKLNEGDEEDCFKKVILHGGKGLLNPCARLPWDSLVYKSFRPKVYCTLVSWAT